MRKHWTYLSLSILIAAALALSGCGTTATATDTTQETQTAVQTASVDANATYVQVQSIQDGTITAVVGTMSQPQMPSGDGTQQGTPPAQPSGSGDSAQQGTPPAQPSGNGDSAQQGTPPEMPSGDSMQQGNPGMMGFTAGDAVITFNVGDATVVTKQNGSETTDAAIADIEMGDILAVTLSSDNTAETIVIQSAGQGNPTQTGTQPGANFGGSSIVTNGFTVYVNGTAITD